MVSFLVDFEITRMSETKIPYVPLIILPIGILFLIYALKFADSSFCSERKELYFAKINGKISNIYTTWETRETTHIVFKDSNNKEIELTHIQNCAILGPNTFQINDSVEKEAKSLRISIFRNGEHFTIMDCSIKCKDY